MMKLNDAMTLLEVRRAAAVEEGEAIEWLLRRCYTLEDALRFYANKNNYLDGVPAHTDANGLLTIDDEGRRARLALGDDVPLSRPLIVIDVPALEERVM